MLSKLSKLWARLTRVSEETQAVALSFYLRYLDNVRWKEFAGVVGSAFTVGTGLGLQLGLLPDKAQWVGYVIAFFVAVAYLRNPKRRDWKTVETDA